MYMLLDGKDWEADYFISLQNYKDWKVSARLQHNQLMDSVYFSDFVRLDYDGAGCLRGTIPGCDRTFLEENGLSDDPYFGRNLDRTRWAEEHAWAFRKKFFLPESWSEYRRIILRCRGIDYEADVVVNGTGVSRHKGMFIPVEMDVTALLKPGQENMVAFCFEPIPQASPNHFEKQYAEFTQFHRLQMAYGWDWSRHMCAAAIWDSVELIGYREARVKDFFIRHEAGKVFLDLDIESLISGTVELDAAVTPDNFSGQSGFLHTEISLTPGGNHCTVEIGLPDMHFWNPVHYGNPDCYQVSVTLDGNTETKITGFKTLEMRYNPGSPEGAYPLTFTVNGQEIFARGLNYVPIDLMFARNTPADYERIVHLAAAAGFNLFRIWGGGMVEKEAFYAACDRHGVMVWQEFMHSCSNYPKDPEFMAFKKREGEAIIRKVRNHASLVMLCGGNEMQYYGEIPDSPVLLQYQTLAAQLAPHLPYHVSCPDLSRPGERNHGPWTFTEHSCYNIHRRLLASEIGCNGMPEFASLQKFIPEHEIKAMHGQALRYHFFNDLADDRKSLLLPIAKFEYHDMEQLCQASMAAQADALQYIMEHYRKLAPEASGCFIWQYNEPWPTCSFSFVDYYTVPKMAYYALKKANSPYLVSITDDSWCIDGKSFHGTGFVTVPQDCTGTAVFEAFDTAGTLLWRKEVFDAWQSGTTEAVKLDDLPLAPGVMLVRSGFTGENGEVLFADTRLYGVPDFKQAFELPRAEVVCQVSSRSGDKVRFAVSNTGKTAVLKLRLSCPDVPEKVIYWQDNYITLLPGETVDIEAVIPEEYPVKTVNFSAWNA